MFSFGEERLQLLVEPLLRLRVGLRVAQLDVAVRLDRDAVVRRGAGPRSRARSRSRGGPPGRASTRGPASSRPASRRGTSPPDDLPDHLDVPERELEVVAAEVEVVQPERLLEDGPVLLTGEREHGDAVVEHVVAADLIRAVGEPVRVVVVGRGEEQLRGVRRAAGDDDDVAGEALGLAAALDDDLRDLRSGAVGLELVALAFVRSVTLGCSSAGRTPSTSASDFAWTRHGKPSQVAQRTQWL